MQRLSSIYRLGLKELVSLLRDPVLMALLIYAFTVDVYVPAAGAPQEFRNASIAIVDEDLSPLSARIADGFLPPYFLPPERLSVPEIDAAMDEGRYTFVVDIPPKFQNDVIARHRPDVQVNVDATAVGQAFLGASYIGRIIHEETDRFLGAGWHARPAVGLAVRAKFNQNLESRWFVAVMHLVQNVTLLGVVLTGAAILREREQGTLDHLLVMPLGPFEILAAKFWANSLAIVVAATLSLVVLVIGVLRTPIAGSIPLFVAGMVVYLFAVTSVGVFLALIARTMPRFGLLFIPVIIIMVVLSGGHTPIESVPDELEAIMRVSPTTHFVRLSTAILFRDAGIELVWDSFLVVAGLGAAFFTGALLSFRASLAAEQS